jgi:hypothetical protein
VNDFTYAARSRRHIASHTAKVLTQTGDIAMFTKTAFALAIIIGTVSGSLAATKHQSPALNHGYDARGTYAGSDPDANIRFELRRDSANGSRSTGDSGPSE